LHRLGLRRLRLAHALRVGGHRAFLRGRLLGPGLRLAHAAHRAGVWLAAVFRVALGLLAIALRLAGFLARFLARLGLFALVRGVALRVAWLLAGELVCGLLGVLAEVALGPRELVGVAVGPLGEGVEVFLPRLERLDFLDEFLGLQDFLLEFGQRV